ncbi:MAG: hypothetical protein RIR52_1928, partial [Acidobacteriota bacterium]
MAMPASVRTSPAETLIKPAETGGGLLPVLGVFEF